MLRNVGNVFFLHDHMLLEESVYFILILNLFIVYQKYFKIHCAFTSSSLVNYQIWIHWYFQRRSQYSILLHVLCTINLLVQNQDRKKMDLSFLHTWISTWKDDVESQNSSLKLFQNHYQIHKPITA